MEFTEDRMQELERRAADYEANPEDTYSLSDVHKELEERLGRKIEKIEQSS
ncbi:MAG: hypothetical protein AAF518_19560 [Spirochaetota bacterium]